MGSSLVSSFHGASNHNTNSNNRERLLLLKLEPEWTMLMLSLFISIQAATKIDISSFQTITMVSTSIHAMDDNITSSAMAIHIHPSRKIYSTLITL